MLEALTNLSPPIADVDGLTKPGDTDVVVDKPFNFIGRTGVLNGAEKKKRIQIILQNTQIYTEQY